MADTSPKIFSLQSILPLGGALFAGAIAWATLQAETAALANDFATFEAQRQADEARQQAQTSAFDARVRNLEVAGARQQSDLDALLRGIERIEDAIKRLEAEQ